MALCIVWYMHYVTSLRFARSILASNKYCQLDILIMVMIYQFFELVPWFICKYYDNVAEVTYSCNVTKYYPILRIIFLRYIFRRLQQLKRLSVITLFHSTFSANIECFTLTRVNIPPRATGIFDLAAT